MRSRHQWHRGLTEQLTPAWPTTLTGFTAGDMLNVELGLYLLEEVMPDRAATDAWTLFGGYPYAEAFGHIPPGPAGDPRRLMIRRARHYLWSLRRRRIWHNALAGYQRVPEQLRGYDLRAPDTAPTRLAPSRANDRFAHFEDLLQTPPEFEHKPLPIAGAGEHWYQVRERRHSVVFPADLAPGPAARRHDLDAVPAGAGSPVTVTLQQLRDTAERMDELEAANPQVTRPNSWAKRLARVELLVPTDDGARFDTGQTLTIDRLLHLVGMVGAGKSTLRDILTFWCATNDRTVTIVVGDVAETLAIVDTFTRLGVEAAPVLGHSTRERHIQRLHRRLATAGSPSMLAHQQPAFAFVNSACPVDALRGLEASRPLRVGEAPCSGVYPVPASHPGLFDDNTRRRPESSRPQRHGCPLWSRCPRHHGARELVTAQVWVATPASLVHSTVPNHQTDAVLRYLELACRRSDLFIVDEADRVQMQLDTAFAPASTLVGRGSDSWLDEVHRHNIDELVREGRLQLSQDFIDSWINALNTVTTAADGLYGMLTRSKPLRDWIITDYFSAYTLHLRLLNAWFPDLAGDDPNGEPDRVARRDRLDAVLDAFRDQPLRPGSGDSGDDVRADANQLVALNLQLLHSRHDDRTRQRLRELLLDLTEQDPDIKADLSRHTEQFEFTLLLATLHHRLDFVTMLWPRVETALNLDATSNVLSRRPPKDYEPVIAESPMGNVLGFQFQLDERRGDGGQSGSLRFFRCNGLGRDLLLNLPDLPTIDDRPPTNVLLMSATSWAGASSRYHIDHPVGAVLRPHPEEVKAILQTTFRKEFLYADGTETPLRMSGTDGRERPQVLQHMLRQLAEPDRSLTGASSKLDDELADIDDPGRRRILLLVGSYVEARSAADYLNSIPEWSGRVTVLVSDDADLDHAWQALPRDTRLRSLRRGDVASFARAGGEILVAPLLAIERGHNIVVADGKAAIGTVYFLVRPHPRPDDINLAIQAVNDWAIRHVRSGCFAADALAAGTPDAAGRAFRQRARRKWQRFLTRRLSWTSLPDDEKQAFTWDQLVVMWQVIGRLVRGGVPARVVFVDAAFSPREAGFTDVDTPDTSLLKSMHHVLAPYFQPDSTVDPLDRSLVTALYAPLFNALDAINI